MCVCARARVFVCVCTLNPCAQACLLGAVRPAPCWGVSGVCASLLFVQMGLASGLPTLVHDVLRNSGEGVKAAFFMALILKSCPACVPLTHTLLAVPGFIVEVCHGQGSHAHYRPTTLSLEHTSLLLQGRQGHAPPHLPPSFCLHFVHSLSLLCG